MSVCQDAMWAYLHSKQQQKDPKENKGRAEATGDSGQTVAGAAHKEEKEHTKDKHGCEFAKMRCGLTFTASSNRKNQRETKGELK